MNDRRHDDFATEERLRRAVRFRDAEVTTAPDALGRIRSRVSDPVTRRIRRGPILLIGAAAAAVLIVGGLALAAQRDDPQPDVSTSASASVDDEPDDAVAPGPTSTTSEPAPTSTTTTTTTTTTPPPPELTPTERAEAGLIVWPLDSRSFDSATTAAFSYATQGLGIDDPVLESDCCDEARADDGQAEEGLATIVIAQRAEDGAPFGEATRLELVALDEFNWVVVRALSDELDVHEVTFADDGLVTVTGSGRSFEGAARIVVRSLCDPEGVISPVTVGGGPDRAEFEHVAAHEHCDAPLVVEVATEIVTAGEIPFVTALAVILDRDPDVA